MDATKIKGIIEGFDHDFDNVVQNFQRRYPNMRLREFLNYWAEESMDLLFANRFDPRELYESLDEINKFLMSIVADNSNLGVPHKTIALYFALCIYVKQPPHIRHKIRLTPQDTESISDLLKNSLDSSWHLDLAFVWNQLRALAAIDFVEERCIYGPSLLTNRGSKKETEAHCSGKDYHKESFRFLEDKIEPTVAEIDNLCVPYESIKETLRLNDFKDPTVDVRSVGTVKEFIDQAKGMLHGFKSSLGSGNEDVN